MAALATGDVRMTQKDYDRLLARVRRAELQTERVEKALSSIMSWWRRHKEGDPLPKALFERVRHLLLRANND